MATLNITLPESLLQRFLAEVPPADRDSFAASALEAALDRRRSLTEKQEPKQAGRPPKAAGRKQVTLQIESDLLAALDAIAAARSISRSDAANLVIKEGISDVT